MSDSLRLAIPSTGALHEGAGELLASSDAAVSRVNTRRYTAAMPSIPGIEVIYQRQSDITSLIDNANSDLGIVGLDRYLESRQEDGVSLVLASDLRFGNAKLQLAIPEEWGDVVSVYDLADVAVDFHRAGRSLRVATKYPRLVRRFLQRQGITYFKLVGINGALEAAPKIGYADVIADISDSGNTLRENNLRPLSGGTVTASQAIMICNAKSLADSELKLDLTRRLLERIEARLNSRDYRRVTANVIGDSEDDVARRVLAVPELSGMAGPTVSKVFTNDSMSWYAVQVVAKQCDVLRVVDHLRDLGGSGAAVTEIEFLYQRQSELYSDLVSRLGDMQNRGAI